MANTTNFGWETPDDTDLVKDGASAMRTLGNAIDTSLVDLKGGTTGQVLSKASNTDMDFTWSSVDPLTILDAKGDLISATAADTPARLAVGADGTYLQADSTTSTGLKWGSISAGGMTLISTTTLSGSSVSLSSIPTTYNDLMLVVFAVTGNTSNARVRILPNGSNTLGLYSGLEDTNGFQENNSPIYLAINSNTDRTNSQNAWSITIKNYASTSGRKPVSFFGHYYSGTNETSVLSGGIISTTSAISSLTIDYGGTNTFAGGTVLLYGVK